ncbi:MAG: hypothetical protein AAF337_06085 [Pseudomonadota bacterium]
MRLLQLPLWLCIGIGLAIFFGSINKDMATALIFGSTFGLVYGGGMAMMKKPSEIWSRAKRQPTKRKRRDYAQRF